VLVLTRDRNQSIVIGEDIVITVVEIRGDKVKLGISAPREVKVHREEVAKLIAEQQNQEKSSRAKTGRSAR
jgi:carbon storage regulator